MRNCRNLSGSAVAENAGPIEAHYAMNEFVAALRVADEAPLQYFDGFHDRHDGRIAASLPTLEIEPSRPASAPASHAGCGWHADVEGTQICIAATPLAAAPNRWPKSSTATGA